MPSTRLKVRPTPSGRRAFTMVELLVVVTIIVVIASIVLFSLGKVRSLIESWR